MVLAWLACAAAERTPDAEATVAVGTDADLGTDDSGAAADTGHADTSADTDTGGEILRDEFDAFDTVRWAIADWTLADTAFVARNVSVHDGSLDLRHRGSTVAGWTGGEIYSLDEFSSGVWNARITAPTEPGTVCAFFFYSWADDADGGVTNEIDVELLAGKAMVGTYADWHEGDGYETSPTHEWAWVEAENAGAHDYGLAWTPAGVAFTMDGVEVAHFTTAVPAGNMALHFNHWTTDGWDDVAGPPDANDLHCTVDWVAGG